MPVAENKESFSRSDNWVIPNFIYYLLLITEKKLIGSIV